MRRNSSGSRSKRRISSRSSAARSSADISTSILAATQIDRRTFIKSTGLLGLGALAGSGKTYADPPVQWYFDTVNGSDTTKFGTSPSDALRGFASGKRIRDKIDAATGPVTINIARGSVYAGTSAEWGSFGPGMQRTAGALSGLTIEAYGEGDAPVFDCTDSIRAGSADPRAATHATTGWTRLGSSKVWRLPLGWATQPNPANNMRVQRLWVTEDRVERDDLPIRIIIGGAPTTGSGGSLTYVLPTETQIVSALTGALNVEICDDWWDRCWYAGPSDEHPEAIFLYMYSSDVDKNPVEDNGVIYLSMMDYGYNGLKLVNCTDFLVSDIEIWGGNERWIRIDGGSGTLRRVVCRYGNLTNSGIRVVGNSATSEFLFEDVALTNDLVSARFYIANDVDASGRRGGGSNDLYQIEGTLKRVELLRGEIHDGCHSGFSCTSITPGNDFELSITDTVFWQDNVRYGRALNINGQRDCFSSVDISGIVVVGQPTYSQLSGEQINFVDSMFLLGRPSIGLAKSKYSGVVIDKRNTAGYLAVCNLHQSGGDDRTADMLIENCVFYDAIDAPIAFYNYSTDPDERIEDSVMFSECRFYNKTASDYLIDSNKTPGGPAIQMYLSDCESYGYDKAMYCAGGAALPTSMDFPDTGFVVTPAGSDILVDGTVNTLHLADHKVLSAAPY